MLKLITSLVFTLVCSLAILAQGRPATVITDKAILRETPGTNAKPILEFASGAEIKVLEELPPWYVVRAGRRVGWLHGNDFKFNETVSAPAAGVPVGEFTVDKPAAAKAEAALPPASPTVAETAPADAAPSAKPAPAVQPVTEAPTIEPVATPSSSPSTPTNKGGPVQVRGYYRKDGTYVRPHTRSRPRRKP